MLQSGGYGALTERQNEAVNAVWTSSEQLRALIEDVLEFAQSADGGVVLDLQQIDLHALLSSVIDKARPWAQRIGLRLVLDCAEDTGSFISDPQRLKEALLKLVNNAHKFTQPGGTVTVGGAIKGDNVSLYVSDNGPGIAPEDMHNAFESFAAKGRAVSRGGAGLGLAIVNRFVELHHGWVELESDLGKGTRVTCHLPRNPRARREESREA